MAAFEDHPTAKSRVGRERLQVGPDIHATGTGFKPVPNLPILGRPTNIFRRSLALKTGSMSVIAW